MKAKDQAEQDGYEVGITETEESLRAEVTRVCREYCLQVWNEALNQVGVKASSALRRFSTPHQFGCQALQAPRLSPLPRRQMLVRKIQTKLLHQLKALLRR